MKPILTLENAIRAGILLVSAGGTWALMRNDIDRLNVRVAAIEMQQSIVLDRLARIETNTENTKEQLRNLREDLRTELRRK